MKAYIKPEPTSVELLQCGGRALSLRTVLIRSIEDREQEIESMTDADGDEMTRLQKRTAIKSEIEDMESKIKLINYLFNQ